MKPRPFLLGLLACTFAAATFAAETAPSAPPASTVPSDQNYAPRLNYQTYFNDYLALKKGRQFDLIFIGDSITEQWRWGAGWPVWKKHFEDRALDFGLGSDRTQHTLWRLQNIDVRSFAPKVACILIGTNNTPDTPEDIAAGVKAVVETTKSTFPGIKVVVVSILPNARANDKMAAANQLIRPLADGRTVHYLDLAAKFTPQGESWKGLSRDRLHLTAEGYEMWAAELETLLPQLLAR
jgi:lysophospholipase L1-like esterase